MHGRLARILPQPAPTAFGQGFVYRYAWQGLREALIQKLARVVTGLRSARLLSYAGLFQEQAAIHRMLDDICEDITFLTLAGIARGPLERVHAEYLRCFYLEEWADPLDPTSTLVERPTVPRKKIHAFLSRNVPIMPVSDQVAARRTLQKLYSGYVHAASPQVMDLYGGSPPKWHLDTMLGTEHEAAHISNLQNVFYRGIAAFGMTSALFTPDLNAEAVAYTKAFAKEAGKNLGAWSASS